MEEDGENSKFFEDLQKTNLWTIFMTFLSTNNFADTLGNTKLISLLYHL